MQVPWITRLGLDDGGHLESLEAAAPRRKRLRIQASDIMRGPQLTALRAIEHPHGFLTKRIDFKTRLVRTRRTRAEGLAARLSESRP